MNVHRKILIRGLENFIHKIFRNTGYQCLCWSKDFIGRKRWRLYSVIVTSLPSSLNLMKLYIGTLLWKKGYVIISVEILYWNNHAILFLSSQGWKNTKNSDTREIKQRDKLKATIAEKKHFIMNYLDKTKKFIDV